MLNYVKIIIHADASVKEWQTDRRVTSTNIASVQVQFVAENTSWTFMRIYFSFPLHLHGNILILRLSCRTCRIPGVKPAISRAYIQRSSKVTEDICMNRFETATKCTCTTTCSWIEGFVFDRLLDGIDMTCSSRFYARGRATRFRCFPHGLLRHFVRLRWNISGRMNIHDVKDSVRRME